MTQELKTPIPFPDVKALGYRGNKTLVAFWWEPGGDELACYDGVWLGVGQCDHWAFLKWLHLSMIWPEDWEIGDSETDAKNFLVVDTRTNTLTLMDRVEAYKKLRVEALGL